MVGAYGQISLFQQPISIKAPLSESNWFMWLYSELYPFPLVEVLVSKWVPWCLLTMTLKFGIIGLPYIYIFAEKPSLLWVHFKIFVCFMNNHVGILTVFRLGLDISYKTKAMMLLEGNKYLYNWEQRFLERTWKARARRERDWSIWLHPNPFSSD